MNSLQQDTERQALEDKWMIRDTALNYATKIGVGIHLQPDDLIAAAKVVEEYLNSAK